MMIRTDHYLIGNREAVLALQKQICAALGLKIPEDRIISVTIELGSPIETTVTVTRHVPDPDLSGVDWSLLENNLALDE